MPPTPFHPTHQTPFKSTVSTSQQSRVHHTPFEAAPADISISVADIDPAEWRYHAEGGKNVLLSFAGRSDRSAFATPTCTFALRIPKHLPSGQEDDDEEEVEEFTNGVVAPLLGTASIVPRCIRIPITTPRDRNTIETLAARIEMHRPPTRRCHPARIRSEKLTCIYAVEDVTAPLHVGGGSPVLCVEIKPKWGFLARIDSLPPSSPNVEIKARFSRYRMHRVARSVAEGGRMTREQFEALYDPLDLYSRDAGRKGRAVEALYRDWRETKGGTNNLRLFWNGELVKPDDSHALKEVAQFLNVNAEDELVGGLTQHIVQELSKPFLPSSDGQGQDILSKLSHLQSALDPLDVEGLAHLWLSRTQSHTLGESASELPTSLTTPLPVSQLMPVLEAFLANEREVRLEEALQAFLVSATFKDCSLLLRFESGKEAQTKVVDLDRKAWSKLGRMQATDAEVCAAFLGWLEAIQGEVV